MEKLSDWRIEMSDGACCHYCGRYKCEYPDDDAACIDCGLALGHRDGCVYESPIPSVLGDRRPLRAELQWYADNITNDGGITPWRMGVRDLLRQAATALDDGEAREAALQRELAATRENWVNEERARADMVPHAFQPQSYPDEDICEDCDQLQSHAWHALYEAEAAIVSLQAERDRLHDGYEKLYDEDVANARKGVAYYCRCPHSFNGVLDSLDASCDMHKAEMQLATLQAQLQAITQEIREASWCLCPCHVSPLACSHGTCLECCDGSPTKWADALDAAAKGQQ